MAPTGEGNPGSQKATPQPPTERPFHSNKGYACDISG